MGIKDFARVTDLFVEGREVVLQELPEPILVWANKLNSFEAEESRRDGQAARSRLVLALKEIGSPESDTFEASLSVLDVAAVKEGLVDAKFNERYLAAIDAVQRDKDWAEKLAMVQRQYDATLSPEEAQLIEQINTEYAAEIDERAANARSQQLRELDQFPEEQLREQYREAWRDQRGMAAFTREYNKSRLFFSVRVCSGRRAEAGGWDHGHCGGHRKRMLDDRDEVVQLPDGLLDLLLTATQDVNLDRRQARFLAGTASSSAPSASPSEAEASTASTPEETSPELVTTSS